MSERAGPQPGVDESADIRRLRVGAREFVLVGTAHVSRESADLVARVIEQERPDRVCVELDEQRYEALARRTSWEKLDLRQILRNRQLATLMANLLLGSYQKKLGDRLGVLPGTELLEATRVAERLEIPYSLCDREIRITVRRAWRSMSIWQRIKLLAVLLTSAFGETELSEEDLRELRRSDVLSELMEDLSQAMPALKRVLIDERDVYLAESIRRSAGDRIVAVVGAGHLEGVARTLEENRALDLAEIRRIPESSPAWKWFGWAIPVVIVALLAFIASTQGLDEAGDNLAYWILVNGIPCSLGAIVAFAHPLTILAAFISAPLTSLTPLIGAGYVTAFVQAWIRPPRVHDFESVLDDAGHAGAWWRNRLLRVLLAFVFPTLGSVLGTYLGLGRILSSAF